MLNRTTVPQSIADGLKTRTGVWSRERWRRLADLVYLPESARGFLFFVLGLLVLAGTMAIHVLLSAQLLRLEVQLAAVNSRIDQVERLNDNIVFSITDKAALSQVYVAALQRGYVPLEEPAYVVRDVPALAQGAAAVGVTSVPDSASPPTVAQADRRDWWAAYWREVRTSGREFLRWFRPAQAN